MAHLTGKLTVKELESAKPQKSTYRLFDGGGLHLVLTPTGGKYWVLRTVIKGKRTDLGLGGLSYTPLQEARRKAQELRSIARNGGDPRLSNHKEMPTFADLAQQVYQERLPSWKNPKHAAQWINTLETYAYPEIGRMTVDQIDSRDVLKVLSPIWLEKPETARRVMQRIGVVLDVAKARKYRAGENPIQEIKALNVLPKQATAPRHHGALAWKELPDFYAELIQKDAIAALALRLLILTAARTSEVIGATWEEIDLGAQLWTIPPERMKAKRDHQVPLCDEAVAILEKVQGISPRIVFEGQKRHTPMSNMAMENLLRRMNAKERGITVHGFRSTFRDWAGDIAKARREVAEAALAHIIKNKTEAAYARSTHLEERRALMDRWGQFVTGDQAKVVRLNG